MLSCIDQPTMRREYRSTPPPRTASPRLSDVGKVGSPTSGSGHRPGTGSPTLSAHRAACGQSVVGAWLVVPALARSRSMRCGPRSDLAQHVVTYGARAVGASLRTKLLVDLRAQHFIAEAALASGPLMSRSHRDTERLAHQIDRPGLGGCHEAELHRLLREVGRGFQDRAPS